MSAVIETFTGESFAPLEPVEHQIHIKDIAHALSNQCRFSGHTKRHRSVAEHSIQVSYLIEWAGGTKEEQLWGLLHDASEAYLVDLPTPLKLTPVMGLEYRGYETILMRVICHRFNLPEQQPEIVTWADQVSLATEVRDLMCNPDHPHWDKIKKGPPADRDRIKIAFQYPEDVERLFIDRYLELASALP